MKLVAVIPAYNEEKHIGQVIRGVKKYAKNIIVIDDGPEDKTRQATLKMIEEKFGPEEVSHIKEMLRYEIKRKFA